MSELKVNEISGLGGTVKINGQVGLPSIVGTNKLTVDGTIRAEGSIEVVTVSAETYGVKVKGPQSPSTGDSIIKFTSYTETERAAISAKDDRSLVIGTNGIERFTIDSVGLITHKYKSAFTGTSQFDGVATFSPVPECRTQCSASQQLANKAYVDAQIALLNSQLNSQLSKYILLEPVINIGSGTNIYSVGVPRTARLIHVQYTVDTGTGPFYQTASMTINGVVRASRNVGNVYAHGSKDGTGTTQYFTMPTAKYYGLESGTESAILNIDYGGAGPYGYGMQITGYTT